MLLSLLASAVALSAASSITSGIDGTVCLDIIDGKSAPGTGVQIWSCNANPQQSWLYRDNNLKSLDKCLQPVGGSAGDGTLLEIVDCSTSTQQWRRVGTTFTWKDTYCLDLSGGITWNGRRPQVWTCYAGNSNQVWNYDGVGLFNGQSSSTERTVTMTTTMTTTMATVKTSAAGSSTNSVRSSFSTSQPSSSSTGLNKPSLTSSSTSLAASTAVLGKLQPLLNTNMCLDTIGPSSNNGAQISLTSCGTARSWQYKSGTIQSNGMCLDVPGGSQANGNFLQLWQCYDGNANQQWTRVGNTIIFANKYCMDVPNGNAQQDQAIQMWECTTANPNQQWQFSGSGLATISGSSTSSSASMTGTAATTTSAAATSQSLQAASLPQSARLIGRTWPGASNPTSPQTLSWAASGVLISFTNSTTINVSLDLNDNPVFSIILDGVSVAKIQSATDIQPIKNLDPTKTYTIQVIKINEGGYGTANLNGFILDVGGKFVTPAAGNSKLLEIIGDSISNGYGDLGTNGDCAATAFTEDATQAFGAVAAKALGADVSVIASQGWGVYSDYKGDTAQAMPLVYGQAVFNDPMKPWVFARPADAIFINLGTNDYYQLNNFNNGSLFTSAYTSFLSTIRSHNPSAPIFISIAPVLSGSGLRTMASLTNTAIKARQQAGDTNIRWVELNAAGSYNLTSGVGLGCQQHPNAAAQQVMGQVLANSLKPLLNW